MNLGQLKEQDLMKTIIKMQEVNLAETQLSTRQVEIILEGIIEQENVRLRSIDFSGNKLADVNEKKLAKCVLKIETVSLRYCRLTDKQVKCICEEILDSEDQRQINNLNVEGNSRNVRPSEVATCKTLIQQLKKLIHVDIHDDGDCGWTPTPLLRIVPPRPYYN